MTGLIAGIAIGLAIFFACCGVIGHKYQGIYKYIWILVGREEAQKHIKKIEPPRNKRDQNGQRK